MNCIDTKDNIYRAHIKDKIANINSWKSANPTLKTSAEHSQREIERDFEFHRDVLTPTWTHFTNDAEKSLRFISHHRLFLHHISSLYGWNCERTCKNWTDHMTTKSTSFICLHVVSSGTALPWTTIWKRNKSCLMQYPRRRRSQLQAAVRYSSFEVQNLSQWSPHCTSPRYRYPVCLLFGWFIKVFIHHQTHLPWVKLMR